MKVIINDTIALAWRKWKERRFLPKGSRIFNFPRIIAIHQFLSHSTDGLGRVSGGDSLRDVRVRRHDVRATIEQRCEGAEKCFDLVALKVTQRHEVPCEYHDTERQLVRGPLRHGLHVIVLKVGEDKLLDLGEVRISSLLLSYRRCTSFEVDPKSGVINKTDRLLRFISHI